MDTVALLESIASGPKPWVVRTIYEDGNVRILRQPRETMALNFAEREARKIGRDLIDRDTGATVRVAKVTVGYEPEGA